MAVRYNDGMARKTSIYLTDEMQQRVEASGVSVIELVRRGLGSGSEPLETVVARALRTALDEYCGGHREALPVAADLQDGTPPEPAEPPGESVAVPEGKSAPMERRSPEPRTDPEPERKRRAPARRAAKTSPERVRELRDRALASGVKPIADPAELGVAGVRAHQAEVAAQSVPPPPPEHGPTVPVWQSEGEEAYIPPLLAPDIPDDEDKPRKPCKHPAGSIDENGVCECGEEMYS
jgi:hypothetical protein